VTGSPRDVICPACFALVGEACSSPVDDRHHVPWHHDSRVTKAAALPTSNAGQPQPHLTLSPAQRRQVMLGRALGLSEREIAHDLAPQLDPSVTIDQIVRTIR
jgi:hypothetical protein